LICYLKIIAAVIAVVVGSDSMIYFWKDRGHGSTVPPHMNGGVAEDLLPTEET
jgi:hypothetical protein